MQLMNEKLKVLQEQFTAALPGRMALLRGLYQALDLTAWRSDQAAVLYRGLHSLTGSAGTFGLQSVSAAARLLELRVKAIAEAHDAPDRDAWVAIGAELDSIERLTQSRPPANAFGMAPPQTASRVGHKHLIYLVEDDVGQAGYMAQVLCDSGYRVCVFTTLDEFRAVFGKSERPDAVILDMIFPEGDSAGIELLTEFRQHCEICPPVVFVSARDDIDARLAAYRAGANRYVLKPVIPQALVELIDALTCRVPPQPYRVMLVDDDPMLLEAHSAVLSAAGMTVQAMTHPREALVALDAFRPDVMLLDVYMTEVSGPELAAIVRERDDYLSLPILFLSAETNMSQQLRALDLGGDDFLVKPVHPEHLISAVTVRARRARQNSAIQRRLQTLLYEREREHLALEHHAIVSVADARGNITYVNDLFCRTSGYSRDELTGQNHRIVKSDRHPPEFYQTIWQTILRGEVWKGEICNRRKDGSYYWVESTITPFVDDDGIPYQYVSIRTEITNAKAAEEAIQQQQRFTQDVLDSASANIAVLNRDGIIVAVNEPWRRFSAQNTAVPGAPVSNTDVGSQYLSVCRQAEANDVRDASGVVAGIESVMSGQAPGFRHEYACHSPSEARWFEMMVTPLSGKNGGVVVSHVNITERKLAEIALSKSAEQLNATLESTKDGILAVDNKANLLFMNQKFREIWNIPEELSQAASGEQLLMHAATQVLDPDGFKSMVRALYLSDQESEELIELKDGRVFERYSQALRDGMNQSGRVWSFHDITERRRAEQSAEAARERLRRGQLFANIGTWEWNIVTGELFWTERIAPLFGYPDGNLETTFENFLAAIHEDDRQAVVDACYACIDNHVPYEIEHRVVWPDGTERWLLERGAVVRDASGNAVQMLGVVQDVDDRKRAEMELAEREQDLVNAQSLALLGNWRADQVSGELIWSDEIYRIFGYEPGAITPSIGFFRKAVHPDDREMLIEHEQQAEKNGTLDLVHRIVLPDGSIRHVHELALATLDDQGRMISLAGTVQDVTQRVEAEQRLRETEQRFAFAVEGAGDGIWDWDIISGSMSLSPEYELMLGYQTGELEPRIETWKNAIHREDISSVEEHLQAYFKGLCKQYNIELRLRCKDGSYKWVLCRATAITHDADGQVTRMIGIHNDIHERKISESALQIFKHVVNSVLDGVIVIDSTGIIQVASPSVTAIFGYAHEEVVGQNVTMLMPEPFRSEHHSYIRHYVETGEERVINRQVEVKGRRANGNEFPLEVAVSEISVGQARYFVGLLRDISARKRSEQNLIAAREAAQRANRAKSEFLSSMSHELRTPMNAILGFSQLMEYDDNLPADHQDSVKEILKAGSHLLELINEVLDLAKVESGKIDIVMEPVELGPVVEECRMLMGPLANQHDVRLSHHCSDSAVVLADRTRLKQVILNLFSNAIKYNRPGGSVSIDVEPEGDQLLRVRVTDTGWGIPEEKLGELFQPFNRLYAGNSNIEGTGIGLTITRRIVELMGGKVGVQSEEGVGSTFWFELPRGLMAANPIRDAKDSTPDVASGPEKNQLVLYIEDNPANLKLVRQILELVPDIHLITAHTPELGIELALAHRPDLILLDINLPGMDGYQVLELLRTATDLQSTPVIAVTANAMPRDIERGLAAGFDAYLTKPLNIGQFLDAVRRSLVRQQA